MSYDKRASKRASTCQQGVGAVVTAAAKVVNVASSPVTFVAVMGYDICSRVHQIALRRNENKYYKVFNNNLIAITLIMYIVEYGYEH